MASVQVAVSPLGGPPGVTAYHSSVLVAGREFSFSHTGVSEAAGAASHEPMGGSPTVLDFGPSVREGRHLDRQLVAVLAPHFQRGTYDLLRKNCNAFTDAALFFLTRQRLSSEYRAVERLASSMPSLINTLSGGCYVPNPLAEDFDLEALIRILDSERVMQADRWGVDRYSACPGPLSFLSWLSWENFACLLGRPVDPALQADASLARELQEEEENILVDEQVARALQAEEEASSRLAAAPDRRSRLRGGGGGRRSRSQGSTREGDARGQANGRGDSVHRQRLQRMQLLLETFRDAVGSSSGARGSASSQPPGQGLGAATIRAHTVETTFSGPANVLGVRERLRSLFQGKRAIRAGPTGGPGMPDEEAEVAKECAVCLEAFCGGERLRILPCLHCFHKNCVDSWLQHSPLCPLCKHSILP